MQSLSSLLLVISFYVVVYERKKSSITMAVMNIIILVINILLLMSTLGFGYDIFSTLFQFHFQYNNYQRPEWPYFCSYQKPISGYSFKIRNGHPKKYKYLSYKCSSSSTRAWIWMLRTTGKSVLQLSSSKAHKKGFPSTRILMTKWLY